MKTLPNLIGFSTVLNIFDHFLFFDRDLQANRGPRSDYIFDIYFSHVFDRKMALLKFGLFLRFFEIFVKNGGNLQSVFIEEEKVLT